ncbi:8-oxo-dGTP pyrophosphatase MutT (NUDIX family) [Novosphingobium chloroacetimidivorans]|uniref:8-oxo-dGTP pyrophosphatase MutT (NUDIX family) n=1 Tax=Novosphingobium chloroacetimidivorans TaxID=1428314 RepID=A0A7W7NWJ1_9SPHN|nr:NUDIX domain-containing protein [Novosphingobium chloroacetimidivorans]MBB4858215.1 8-oxo-dGTP pyrophosphatase MutT (NUDIX family) [Novosphingobium chloroacetimidivorans]
MPEDTAQPPLGVNDDTGIPTATVVIFRRAQAGPPELLMVQRSRQMRFAGGAAVFPGGKVDPGDRVLAAQLCPDEDPVVAAARIAAIRETLEETGLAIAVREPVCAQQAADARTMLIAQGALGPVVEAFGWTLEPARLTLYAHWRAPSDRGFDTHFFVTDLGTGEVDIAVDATENTKLFWISAAHALELADSGEISVIFPTRRNLERLAQFATFEDALSDIARHPVRRITPGRTERDGEPWLQIPDGHGYPVLGQPLATAARG